MDSLVFGILVSIQKIFVRSESQYPDFRAFKIAYVQTIVRSKLHMARLPCVQNCICPDYRAFKIAYVQTIVRSFSVPDRVILNARRHLVRSFRSGHIDFRSGTSTWATLLCDFCSESKEALDSRQNFMRTLSRLCPDFDF